MRELTSRSEEHLEQSAFIAWKDYNLHAMPELRLGYSIPNGVYVGGNYAQIAKLKREGLRKGAPDWCLPVPAGRYSALYLEFKSKTGSESKEQIDFRTLAMAYGNLCCVVRTAQAAREVVVRYLEMRRDAR